MDIFLNSSQVSEAVSLFSIFFQEQHQLFKDQMKRLQKFEKKLQEKVVARGGTVGGVLDDDSEEEGVRVVSAPSTLTTKGKGNKEKKPKKIKDPNEPSKAKTAYICFVEENQPSLKAANPEAKPNEIFALLGAKWKELDESKKQVFL